MIAYLEREYMCLFGVLCISERRSRFRGCEVGESEDGGEGTAVGMFTE
jgi:hypothetical protein